MAALARFMPCRATASKILLVNLRKLRAASSVLFLFFYCSIFKRRIFVSRGFNSTFVEIVRFRRDTSLEICQDFYEHRTNFLGVPILYSGSWTVNVDSSFSIFVFTVQETKISDVSKKARDEREEEE